MGSVTERVDSLIAAGDLDSVAGVCDEFEIVAGGAGNVPEWPHATHVLSRMLAGDLERARCVLERAPEHLRERDPELRAVHAVLAAMLDRDQPAVHAAAGAHAWSPRCAPLAASLIERYRAATLDLMSRAYTTASCAHVAACLGVTVEEAVAQGVGMGWSLGEDGMFGVVRRKVDDEAEALGMDAVEKLSAMMVMRSSSVMIFPWVECPAPQRRDYGKAKSLCQSFCRASGAGGQLARRQSQGAMNSPFQTPALLRRAASSART